MTLAVPRDLRRNHGLDIARALAAMMVLWGHLVSVWFAGGFGLRLSASIAYLGVELFFSLSGFLIGQRLIVLAGRERPWAGVPRFLAARWLRTLPMYYAALLYMTYRFKAWNPLEFAFLQTLFPERMLYLVGSWSLAVEEFFYLFFPLLLCGLIAAGPWRGVGAVARLAGAVAVLCLLARFGAAWAGDWIPLVSYKQHALYRFDCTAFGVLAACAWSVWRARIETLLRGPAGLWALGIGGGFTWGWSLWNAVTGQDVPEPHPHPWGAAVMPTVATSVYALLVLALACRYAERRGIGAAVTRHVARVSYSIYLLQFVFLTFLYPDMLALFGRWSLVPMTAVVLGAATLSYWLIEAPFMRLRPRSTPVRA